MDKASIYVAIIGDKNSDWTIKEFEEAWMRGIPVLIYDCRKRKSRGTTISRWLNEIKERGIRIEDPEIPYRNTEDLTFPCRYTSASNRLEDLILCVWYSWCGQANLNH